MGAPPAVLMLDDGELDDIHQILQELAIPCARIRGGAIVTGTPAPKDLLIATPRRIDAVEESVGDAVSPTIRVMVVNEDSNALRARLRRSGFDYLVRRPVHSEALRLLLLHCLYKGEERRREPRVAVGFEVGYRAGLLTRRATLLDLSVRGCRLHSRHRVEPGKRIKLMIPEALDAGDPISVTGRVVRSEGAALQDASAFALGVVFEGLDEGTRQALELLIDDRVQGPATLRRGTAAVAARNALSTPAPESDDEIPAAEPPSEAQDVRVVREAPRPRLRPVSQAAPPRPAATPAAARERRQNRRGSYAQTIPAFGNRALRVLVGRDLSVAGMRIEPLADLDLDDRLHLAIYGEAGEEPMLVWGRVARHDGSSGHVILFEPFGAEIAARLERLVAGLPSVESLSDSEAEAMGTVLTEIVGRGGDEARSPRSER